MMFRILIASLMILGLVTLGFVPRGELAVPVAQAQSESEIHIAIGTVTQTDSAGRTVTISHGAEKSLEWPAMTMAFGVKDKGLLEKLAQGKKARFEFVQQGNAYIIVGVKQP